MVVDNLTLNPVLREIIDQLMSLSSPTRRDVAKVKLRVAAKHHLRTMPSNAQIIELLNGDENVQLLPILKRKVTRIRSGVVVIAVMTKPHSCPQPEPCAYCPGGPPFGVPQSYTGFEPAAMRGLQNRFNPYLQVKSRIRQLQAIGHNVDKIELIVMGGTFPATPSQYQSTFIQRCLDAITNKESTSLEEAKLNAETSRVHNVGITVETRPDWAKEQHVDKMLQMGVTRVEVGVQNPNNQIFDLVGRSHTVQDVIEATRILKDAGLKIAYHLMPGLPGSTPHNDLDAFTEVFTNPDYKPDMIKIYPCLVLKGTKVYEWYRAGKYKPYTNEQAVDLIVKIKKRIPPWVRVMRVQRDIPAPLIIAGVNQSNLRQLVHEQLEAHGMKCRCIRCREVSHRFSVNDLNIDVTTTKYVASEGDELFIAAEDCEHDVLIGYVRLRIPSPRAHRPEIQGLSCSIVRELHIYGPMVPVGHHSQTAWQHHGYGHQLLAEAERITKEIYEIPKIVVISALGTKQYYKQLNYKYDGVYMSKTLERST